MVEVKILIFFAAVIGSGSTVRVCTTFLDYYNPFSPNCYNNLDSDRNVTEIVRNWGFTVEEYNVTTDDGYQIFVVRIYSNVTQKTPILLGHGIVMNSLGWVSTYNKTLVYQFVKRGYQVFLINYRGTLYSQVAGRLTQSDRDYWKYSFHQMGIYDLPKTLELIKKITGQKCIYIGFSMGTTASYIYASVNATDASDKLVGIISLAPVATLNHVRSLLGNLAPLWPFIRPFVEVIWNGQVLPRNPYYGRICGSLPIFMFLCETFFRGPFFGFDYPQMDSLYSPVTLILNTETAGIDVVTHFAQIINSGRFQQFSYGKNKNIEVYGNAEPPEYNVTNIPVRVALIVGPNDWLATKENAVALYNRLQTKNRCGFTEVSWSQWDHSDFINAKDRNIYLNNLVIKKVDDLIKQTCT